MRRVLILSGVEVYVSEIGKINVVGFGILPTDMYYVLTCLFIPLPERDSG